MYSNTRTCSRPLTFYGHYPVLRHYTPLDRKPPRAPNPPTVTRRPRHNTAMKNLMTTPPNIKDSYPSPILCPRTTLRDPLSKERRPNPITDTLCQPPLHSLLVECSARSISPDPIKYWRKSGQGRENERRRAMRSIHRPLQLWMQNKETRYED